MTYKFQQIRPQKARGVLKDSMWEDPEWVAEEKYDGDRRICQMVTAEARFTGTRESEAGTGFVEKTGNLPHLQVYPRTLDGTVLDGEIIAPLGTKVVGGASKYVTSIMGSSPEEAIRKQKERGWLRYVVFDCLYFKGVDVRGSTLLSRRAAALSAVKLWGNEYVTVENPLDRTLSKSILYAQILKRGGEGVVLKNLAHTYGNEKLWVKVKGEWTADVIVTGFKPGKGKYAGQVGAIEFGQYRKGQFQGPAKVIGFCSGMDDLLRKQLNQRHIGKVFKLIHNGREPTGAFRHPRFDCWRPDKNPKDCVYNPEET